jgi:hypothetical protein
MGVGNQGAGVSALLWPIAGMIALVGLIGLVILIGAISQ